MLVDASFEPGDFYLDTVKNLCANTTYEFAAWILNMKYITQGSKPNITFKIETTDGLLLQSYNTGDVPPEQVAKWRQYGFYFKTTSTATNIVLRMTNNAPGGDGNDLALDDITFRPCGPLVNVAAANGNDITNLCVRDTSILKFSAAISEGYNSPAYQWQVSNNNGTSWTDINGATSNSYSRMPTDVGSYEYRLTVAEGANINISTCRVASNTLTVKINARPVTTAINNGPVCAGNNITLTAAGGTSYSWTGANNFNATGDKTAIYNIGVSGKYYVQVTNSAGCSTTDSTTVTVYPAPVSKFMVSSPACAGSTMHFTDQSIVDVGQTITAWTWDFNDGTADHTINPSHVFIPAKIYPVGLTIRTDKGCSDTLVQEVNIHDMPHADFILPEVCLSDPFAAFANASAIADNSESQLTYFWNFDDVGATAGNPNTSLQKDPQHSYSAIGVYSIHLTVTSKDGCVSDTFKLFTVNGAVPLAKFVVDSAGSLCNNSDVVITNNSSVNFGSIARIEIYWDNQNNPSLKTIDELPQQGKKYNYKYADFGNAADKNFGIKLVAYSGINCVNESTQIITVDASPRLQFDALQPVCEGIMAFDLTKAHELNGLSGTGIYNSTGIANSPSFSPKAAGAGDHIIRYTFTADNNCRAFAEQTIHVYPQPTADAGPDKVLLQGGYLILNANATGNNITYTWAPAIAIDNIYILTPKVNPADDQLYTLNVNSPDGCSSADEVLVKVLKTPHIPNAFSPNGDGINDTWVISYLDSYPGLTLQVYNRYGQMVYHSVGNSKPWDGTYNGSPVPVGTYYYIVDRKIAAPKLTGWVAIIR
ncbi:MAG: PKD domain-containing protein [Panacibacter sp.]